MFVFNQCNLIQCIPVFRVEPELVTRKLIMRDACVTSEIACIA